ncbi:hypothetical protein SAMN05880590_102715 [Rhizobium sp. RU35A]|nr:hypothetical protein SAMN05880590_102715 [Rhizobium sp. RU35A]
MRISRNVETHSGMGFDQPEKVILAKQVKQHLRDVGCLILH